jgi:hypothetical protein
MLSRETSALAATLQAKILDSMLSPGGGHIDEFQGHTRLHVVSDGLTGKIYAPDEE